MKKYAIVALVGAVLALSSFGPAALAADANNQAVSAAPADQSADQNAQGDAATSDQNPAGNDTDADTD